MLLQMNSQIVFLGEHFETYVTRKRFLIGQNGRTIMIIKILLTHKVLVTLLAQKIFVVNIFNMMC